MKFAALRALLKLVVILLSAISLLGASAPAGRPGDGHLLSASAPGQFREAICVDGGMSGRPFVQARCVKTVATLEDAVDGIGPGTLVVVRAFWSNDANSIGGVGTYRDSGLQNSTMVTSLSQPIIIQAEGFNQWGAYVKPIISGAVRVQGTWERAPGTERTWQIAWDIEPGSWRHEGCVDRIWVSRQAGKTQLANFPLTRPLFNQGNDNPPDCGNNTFNGEPMGPRHVDAFPGSYQWLNDVLYVNMPNGEDPNQYTVEVPYKHSMSPGRGSAGLVVRGLRVYHAINGIDLWHCGSEMANRCEATHNETSFNTHFGLQPGRFGLLAYNSGILNTIQMVKITSDFSEIAHNLVGPQLSHGFKLNEVHGCQVHHNQVYSNNVALPAEATQANWLAVGTRDTTAGIYLKNGTNGCHIYDNNIRNNRVGIYLRNDGDSLTRDNVIERNSLLYNETAMVWRDDGLWQVNVSRDNWFSGGATFFWDGIEGPLNAYRAATGMEGMAAPPRLPGTGGSQP